MGADVGFQVQADAITRHATTVDAVADQVAEGKGAASVVNIGRDAYGMLCSLIPSLLTPVQESLINALQEATDSLHSAADDLRATARDYTGSDDRTANQLQGH
jgi:methyl-accepting chemotaxis protein